LVELTLDPRNHSNRSSAPASAGVEPRLGANRMPG
jgi:hypothetical protein